MLHILFPVSQVFIHQIPEADLVAAAQGDFLAGLQADAVAEGAVGGILVLQRHAAAATIII